MKSCFVILLALAAFVSWSEGTSCYSCRSTGTSGYCWVKQENDERTPKKPCESGWCMTKTDHAESQQEKTSVTTSRACMEKVPANVQSGCETKTVRDMKSTTCFCNGDLCNNQETKAEI